MASKLSHIVAAVFLACAPVCTTSMAWAQAAQTYTFVFKDAEIAQVAEEILGNSLGVSYRVEPGVAGKMNFSIAQRLTKPQLLTAFEQALSQYDVVMVQEGETVVLKPRKVAGVGGQVSTAGSHSGGIGFQVRAVPINYGSASEIAKALTSVSRADLVLYSSDKMGLIILGGRSEELDNATTTIGLFDQSTLSDARIRFYPLSNASAANVATDLDTLLKASGTSGVSIAPMRRLNGIFAFSQSADALNQVGNLVQRLDVPSQDESIRVWVYHPHGASAESLAKTLNAMVGGVQDVQAPSATGGTAASAAPAQAAGADPMSAGIRIVADKETNSVIINAPEAMRVRLMEVLNEIDREPAQIFIEASIVEVTLNKDLNYGVDWQKVASHGDLKISSYSTKNTGFGAIAPGFSVNYLGDDISAAITALSSQSRVRIVSAPKIATVENVAATLQVGDQVPIVTQTAQSTTNNDAPLINSIDYRDTGIMLKVTPRLTGSDRVMLEVSQEVSSVARTVTSGIDSPTISQRKLESSLIVPDGTVVALGGLISNSDSLSDNGIPGLKDIPFIGGAFKGQTHNRNRTELIVLLQAHVMRTPSDFNLITANASADLKDLMRDGFFSYTATPGQ